MKQSAPTRVEFSELAMCAVRYALGRMTYVSHSVPEAITKNMHLMTDNALHVIIRDIERYKTHHDQIGMKCDDESWMRLTEVCIQEIQDRRRS